MQICFRKRAQVFGFFQNRSRENVTALGRESFSGAETAPHPSVATFLPAPPYWLEQKLQKEMPKFRPVTVLSGDIFLQCKMKREKLWQLFQAQLVDMESAALAQVASRFNIPFLSVRAVSDHVRKHPKGVQRGQLKRASRASAETVMELIERLPSEKTTESEVG